MKTLLKYGASLILLMMVASVVVWATTYFSANHSCGAYNCVGQGQLGGAGTAAFTNGSAPYTAADVDSADGFNYSDINDPYRFGNGTQVQVTPPFGLALAPGADMYVQVRIQFHSGFPMPFHVWCPATQTFGVVGCVTASWTDAGVWTINPGTHTITKSTAFSNLDATYGNAGVGGSWVQLACTDWTHAINKCAFVQIDTVDVANHLFTYRNFQCPGAKIGADGEGVNCLANGGDIMLSETNVTTNVQFIKKSGGSQHLIRICTNGCGVNGSQWDFTTQSDGTTSIVFGTKKSDSDGTTVITYSASYFTTMMNGGAAGSWHTIVLHFKRNTYDAVGCANIYYAGSTACSNGAWEFYWDGVKQAPQTGACGSNTACNTMNLMNDPAEKVNTVIFSGNISTGAGSYPGGYVQGVNGYFATTDYQILDTFPSPIPATVTPSLLAFGNQQTTTTSPSQTVTYTNQSLVNETLSGIALTTGTQFAFVSSCGVLPQTIAAGAGCSVTVTFTPTTVGSKTDTLTFTDTAPDGPQLVSLTGTGTGSAAPTASLSCNVGHVQLGGSFLCTPTTTNAVSCSADNGVGALPDCSSAFSFQPTIGSYSLTLSATGAGGTTNAAPVSVYVQQRVGPRSH